MAEKIKYTIKELKQPDKFRQFISDLTDTAAANFNKILYTVGGIFVLLLVIYFVSSHNEKKVQVAGEKFENALFQYNAGNTQAALEGFAALIEEQPSQQSAKLALYYTGAINYDLGLYEESISSLIEYLNDSPDNQLLEDSANFTIGLAFYNLKNWQESEKYLSKLQNSGSPYEKQANVNLALAYEKMGEFDKAEDIYKNVLNNAIAQ